MKKLAALLFTAVLVSFALSAKENLISFSAGITSGFPIYGNDSVSSTGSEISNANRIIIGSSLAANLNPIKQASFFLGSDLLCDFTWKDSQKSNKIHISFPLGVKIYPGLGGFNLGLAYTLGFRIDRIDTKTIRNQNDTSFWGNGFKFLIEYNFAHEGKSNYLPSIGGYWNLMPRGNNSYDNLIVLYISANF